MHFVEEMAEAIVGLLFGFDVLFYGQLYFTEEDALKQYVDHDIPRALIQSILDPDYLEGLTLITDELDLLEDTNDLCLPRLNLAPKQIRDLKGNKVDVDIFDVLLIMGMHFLELFWDKQQYVYDFVEIGE